MEGAETDYSQDIESEHANDDEEDEDEASINQDEVENENEGLLNSEYDLSSSHDEIDEATEEVPGLYHRILQGLPDL